MNEPSHRLVSVIIPTYNRAGYVTEAIGSVLAQTYRPLKVILVDDGSTDNTPEAIKQFGDALRYFRQPNQGASAERNRVILSSHGELLAFLDSDNLWEPGNLAAQEAVLVANPDFGTVLGRSRQF